MGKITMQDVALESGVSLATVSRALRNPELVNIETRQRIDRAVEKTKYQYTNAVTVRGGLLPVIGVLVPSTICFGFAETVMGIQQACQEEDFSITVGNTEYDSQTERRLLKKFLKNHVSGVILAGFSLSNESLLREIVKSRVPVCVIWEKGSDADFSYVGFDNFKTTYDLANHLIALGHRRIGLLCGPFSKSDRPHRRLNGYRAALERHNIEYDNQLVYEAKPTLDEGKIGLKKIMSLPDTPSAILAAADVFGLGALQAAWEMGLQVPRDLSIVGLDDIPYAEFSIPPLTTARIPAFAMGYESVQVIKEALKGKTSNVVHQCMDVKIIQRESAQQFSG